MGKERAYSAKPSITCGDQCRASLPGLALLLSMGAGEADGGKRGWWGQARPMGAVGGCKPPYATKAIGRNPVPTAPFAFLLAFMIVMWARAGWWTSALLMTDAIYWSILLGSGTLSSLCRIRRLSAMLEPVVGATPGLAGMFGFGGGTVSHRLFGVGVGADVIAPVGADVALGVGIAGGLSAGVCAGAGFGFAHGFGLDLGFGFGFGFGVGIDLSCLPGCCCWRSSSSSGPPVGVRSACIKASRPTPSVSAVLSLFWPRSLAATALATMSMMPSPPSRSSW